jgi:magnesium chelatase family protein
VLRYRNRISGPLLDRIDLCIDVPALPPAALAIRAPEHSPPHTSTSGAAARARTIAAHARQAERQGKSNSRLAPPEMERHCVPDDAGTALLAQAMARLSLSARAYHRVLKVARTIADLASRDTIAVAHVAEAIGYRRLERA